MTVRFGQGARGAERYTVDEACSTCEASRDEHSDFERAGVLVPNVDRWPWRMSGPYYAGSRSPYSGGCLPAVV